MPVAQSGRQSGPVGVGPPEPLQILTRFTEPNTQLVVLLTDQPANPTLPQSDSYNQYQVTWSLAQDPDAHEPNDTAATATPIAEIGRAHV